MKKPISIFMMDVTNSTKNWEEISAYLAEIEGLIKSWTKGLPNVQVKHRLGDEIVCIFDHYSTAYTVAFYVSQIWKYREQPPYFGLTFGTVESDLVGIDIDKWNHPLMRQARLANEKIKNSANRSAMLLYSEAEAFYSTSSEMINLLLEYQHKLMNEQTKLQRMISSLYAVLEEQKRIAKIVNKSPSTISSHYKKGNCEIILKTLHTIQHSMNDLEEIHSGTSKNITSELTKTIKNYLQQNLNIILSK